MIFYLSNPTSQSISAMPDLGSLPSLPNPQPGTFGPSPEPIAFGSTENFSADVLPVFDSELLLMAIVSCQNVQDATGLDKDSLLRRLAAEWSAECAFKNCEPVAS